MHFISRFKYNAKIVDNSPPPHSEVAPPGTLSGIGAVSGIVYRLGSDSKQPKTSTERSVRKTLHRIYLFTGIGIALFCSVIFITGFAVYRQITYIDPVTPDYSTLETDSENYWTDRTLIDIETALTSKGTDQVRLQRLRTFVHRTTAEALQISTPYTRAQAVTDVARVLAQNDINIVLDNHLQRLGDTYLIVSMRARTLISQALMYLRQNRTSAAQVALRQYRQLVNEFNLKLNSPLNEESFFGAVTIFCSLNDTEGLRDLFEGQKAAVGIVGLDQRMRAYRLIAGEQTRVGMVLEALETAKQITNPAEQARAWTLILQYSARPPLILPVEPVMLDLLDEPPAEPPKYPVYTDRVAHEIFQYLVENKDINTQISLLRRIAGSRLMCDVELYRIFRQSLIGSRVLHERVKQPVLQLLDDPESPSIRAALNMPPRDESMTPQFDSAREDWRSADETILVEVIDIDPTPLRTRADQQWIQALLAIAQSYQSIRRFSDADRILKQASVEAQRFVDPQIRIRLLMQISERQVAIGSVAEAQKTFAVIAPVLNQNQKGDLARLQLLARLFDDAFQTIASIELPAQRELVCSFLLREQLRINRLDDAEKTLALMPQGTAEAENRSRLNIAKGETNRDDFNRLGILFPEGDAPDWERHCIGLIQQGLLYLAYQTAERITDRQKRTDVLVRIAQEYLLLYQAFNEANDPHRTIRQEILQMIASSASRTEQPVTQTTILTELLMYHTRHLKTEADRTAGKALWLQAMEVCRKIAAPDEKTVLFAQLIIAKNELENPNLPRRMVPLFTRETNVQAFAETEILIRECLALINTQEDAARRGLACAHLARAAAQVGRITAAQVLIDDILQKAVPSITQHETLVSLFLSTVPALKAMSSADTIPLMYRLAIDEVARGFDMASNVDVYAWRMRDSDIERIVRSQLENGFVDDAVESAYRLNEPMLRDRLLQMAIYIYLDHGDVERADLETRRLMVEYIWEGLLQNIQVFKRRAERMEL